MNRRWYAMVGCLSVVIWCAPAAVGDEVAAPWGTIHGNLHGTASVDRTAYPDWEYLLGTNPQFSFELDVQPLGWDQPNSDSGISFDEDGNLYWKTQWPDPRIVSVAPDGTPRWEANTDGVPLGSANLHILGVPNGDSATPVVGDGGAAGRVYGIGQDTLGNGIAAAYRKSDGMIQWATILPGSNFVGQPYKLTPVLFEGKLWVVGSPNAAFQAEVYELDSASGAIITQTTIGTTNAVWDPTGGQMTLVKDAFGVGQHGLYFNIGHPTNECYGIRIVPGSGAFDAWSDFAGMIAGPGWGHVRSHMIYSATTGLLYTHTWDDFGGTLSVFHPVTGWVTDYLGLTGHGYYDVGMLDFNGTDVIAGGFDGTIARYHDAGGGSITNGIYATTGWFGESRVFGGLFQDNSNNSIYLTGTNSRTDLGPSYTARVIAVDVTNGTLLNSCAALDDAPIYLDNLTITTNGTTAFDVGGFEAYSLGPIVGQSNPAGLGTVAATWQLVLRNGASSSNIIDSTTIPVLGTGHGKVLAIDAAGGCGFSGSFESIQAVFDHILNQEGIANSNGTIVLQWDQYRPDLGDDVGYSDYEAPTGYWDDSWWAAQPESVGTATAKKDGVENVPIAAGQWQTLTYTFDLTAKTITVSNGVDTSAPATLVYHLPDGTSDAVFAGFQMEISGTPGTENPAIKTTPLFEYDTGIDANNAFTTVAGPTLGPKQPDGIQRAYYFEYPLPHKLVAIQNNFPPEILAWTSTADHGVPIDLIDIPMDTQINIGRTTAQSPSGDAIYDPYSVPPDTLEFRSDEPEGYLRHWLDGGGAGSWWYNFVDYYLAGQANDYIDVTRPGTTFEFETRFFQDPVTNPHPYSDAPVFVRLYTYEDDGTGTYPNYAGNRDYSIVYATQLPWGDPPYPTWTRVVIDVATGTDTGAFDPTRVNRMRFYGTDWDATGDDFVDFKNMKIVEHPLQGRITLSPTAVGPAATSEPRLLAETVLEIEFSEDVIAPPGSVVITGPGGPHTPPLSVDGRFVTATLSPALADGTYTATVTGVTDVTGLGLVGDDNCEFVIRVGDADGDHDCDLADFAEYQQCAGPYDGGPCTRSDFLPSFAIDAGDIPAFVPALEAGGPM
ncbi:MAG: hypothetical protein JSV19_05995 [Phycisphaerales bacterium]|nr:MAG: hypothetical protein JSV19_05995 [Phycisphaerales bacterium]